MAHKIIDANSWNYANQILDIISLQGAQFWLTTNLGTDIFGVWLAMDEDKPAGIAACTLGGEPLHTVVEILKGEGQDDLLKEIEKWAMEKKTNKITIVADEKYPDFEKYGYKFEKAIINKEI